MDRQWRKRIFGAMVGLLISMCWSSEAQAAPLASYRILDLGEGTYEIQTRSDGSSVITRNDDAMYAFPRSLKDSEEAIAVQKTFPPFTDKPTGMGYVNDYYGYSHWTEQAYAPLLSANGVFLGSNVRGVNGHDFLASSSALASQLQADGTYSPLVILWSASVNDRGATYGGTATPLDINKLGQIIGQGMSFEKPFSPSKNMGLYDLNTHKIDFRFDSLMPDWIPSAAKIDDEGRILVYAQSPDDSSLHSLLMLPEGVSAEVVPVPEASTLATLLAGVVGMAYQGMKRRARAIRR